MWCSIFTLLFLKNIPFTDLFKTLFQNSNIIRIIIIKSKKPINKLRGLFSITNPLHRLFRFYFSVCRHTV
nr:hypothetical protein [Cressdnaviricota sp.]